MPAFERVFFLGDPVESLDTEWDSSLRLMAAYRARGTDAQWFTIDDVLIEGSNLILGGIRVTPADLVWLRLDPCANIRWYEVLRSLCAVEARMINPPHAVLTIHDKRSALAFSPRDSFDVFSEAGLAAARTRMIASGVETAVFKPPSLFGSQGIRYIGVTETGLWAEAWAELHPLFGHVIVEPYIGPGGGRPPLDIRVLVTGRRIIGMVERDIPLGGGLQDVRQVETLTPVQAQRVEAVLAYLRANGIVLAGLDFLGDTLTEVNVSCPGALPEIDMFCNVVSAEMILDDVAASLA